MPFFSIIIPTRGRSDLIQFTIKSILRQTFQDFEVLVIDNNLDDETKIEVDKFNDERIKYFKTGGLSMIDNWEFGFEKANGQFLTILSDRLVYTTKYTLDKILNATRLGVNIVSWKWAMCEDDSFEIKGISGTGQFTKINNEELILNFLNGSWSKVVYQFPKALNSCISKNLYLELKKKFSNVFFNMSPDYTFSFLQLLTQKEIVCIDECLFLSGGNSVSNGNRARVDVNVQYKYLKDVQMPESALYDFTPVKAISTRNSIFNDFFKVVQITNSKFSWHDLNMVEYLIVVYNELLLLEQEPERNSRIEKWMEVLLKQNLNVQNNVNQRILKNTSHSKNVGFIEKVSKFFSKNNSNRNSTKRISKFSNIIESIENYESKLFPDAKGK